MLPVEFFFATGQFQQFLSRVVSDLFKLRFSTQQRLVIGISFIDIAVPGQFSFQLLQAATALGAEGINRISHLPGDVSI